MDVGMLVMWMIMSKDCCCCCGVCLGDVISGGEQCSECSDGAAANSTTISSFTVINEAVLTAADGEWR